MASVSTPFDIAQGYNPERSLSLRSKLEHAVFGGDPNQVRQQLEGFLKQYPLGIRVVSCTQSQSTVRGDPSDAFPEGDEMAFVTVVLLYDSNP
jgi:hypothetical protein